MCAYDFELFSKIRSYVVNESHYYVIMVVSFEMFHAMIVVNCYNTIEVQ